MNDYKHAMVDIETLDVKATARILSVAAVRFNSKGECARTVLYAHPSMKEQKEKGRTISANTHSFWQKQPKEAYEEAFKPEEDRCSVAQFQKDMVSFMKDVECVWANSPTFDLAILRHLFDQFGLITPWKFWEERDVRTVIQLFPDPKTWKPNHKINKNKENEHSYPKHHPIGDCLTQVDKIVRTLSNVKLNIGN